MCRSNSLRIVSALVVVLALSLLVGCFESKVPAGPRSASRIDPLLLGQWTLEQMNDEGEVNSTQLGVWNLNGEQYFIEWVSGDDRFRATAWLNDINGVMFASIRGLSDSPTPDEKYTIMRVDLDAGNLKLQNLDAEFFKTLPVDSTEALRAVLAKNLGNEAMYRGEPMFGRKPQ